MNNFIAEAIAWTGMSAQGVVVGAMGAALSLFYINNHGLNLKKSAAVLISGTMLAGYALPMIQERFKWSLGSSAFLAMLIGFMAADFFASVRSASPTFTNWIVRQAEKQIKNKSNENE